MFNAHASFISNTSKDLYDALILKEESVFSMSLLSVPTTTKSLANGSTMASSPHQSESVYRANTDVMETIGQSWVNRFWETSYLLHETLSCEFQRLKTQTLFFLKSIGSYIVY